MGGSECCVKNCDSRSHDHRGRKLLNGLTFHCFPAWRTNEGGQIYELTKRRRAAWVAVVGRSHITFESIPSSMRVCSRHFQSGKPAYEMLDSDPDWVPSLHLGQTEDGHSGKKRRSASTEGLRKPSTPPWREVKSALQSLLSRRPGGETHERPSVKRVDVSFRDFFRNALESSLEASIRSRAQSKNQPEVELNFKLPPLDGEPPTQKESSCSNCSRLLRRIQELEQSLFQLSNKHDDVEHLEALLQPDQDQQSSEEKERLYELTPRSSPDEDLHDVGLDSEMAPFSSDSSFQSSDSFPTSSGSVLSTSDELVSAFV